MWMGGNGCTLAESLVELIHQLEAAYPSQGWQNSPDTGTIGDTTHQAQGSSSDHNPWLNNTVRALDVANSDPNGPDCEALFQMANRMYAAQDPRVYPNGYAIYRGRITDWGNPGGFHAQQGDQHDNHVHISVSQNPAGYNSTAPWPLTGGVSPDAGDTTKISEEDELANYPYIIFDASNPNSAALVDVVGVSLIRGGTAVHGYRDVLKVPSVPLDTATFKARIVGAK